MKRFTLLSQAGIVKAQEVIDVTLGKEKADLAVINATLLNVYTGEYLDDHSVAVKGEWIAYVGTDQEARIGPSTHVIDARGKIVIPGLIDGHTHMTDGMYSPSEFLSAAMAGGTTTIVTETIELFPIAGYEGLVDFLASLAEQPIKVFATAPPMVSTSSRSRGIPKEILVRLLSRDDVLGMGESYWQGVLQRPGDFLPNFKETLDRGKKLEGHSAGAKNARLMAYLASGISSCHEPINAEEVLERLRLGIHVMAREGGARRDLAEISKLRNEGIDLRRLILVTDGVGPQDLLETGYMEQVVQKAIACGFSPVQAVQMATLNAAEYFQLDGIAGGIAPGKHADLVMIPDRETIKAEIVISKGRMIVKEGKPLATPRKHTFTEHSLKTIHLPGRVEASDFLIRAGTKAPSLKVRVIDQVTDLVTREHIATLPVTDGEIRADVSQDLLKVAAVDRRFSPGKTFVGLVRGFGMKAGALASSAAWDTTDIIVVGQNEEDMALAVNRIRELQGGALICAGGRILAEIPLPVFGRFSQLSLETLTKRSKEIAEASRNLGCLIQDPLRTLVTLTGAAIPFLRICEEGLVDIKSGKTLELIVERMT